MSRHEWIILIRMSFEILLYLVWHVDSDGEHYTKFSADYEKFMALLENRTEKF